MKKYFGVLLALALLGSSLAHADQAPVIYRCTLDGHDVGHLVFASPTPAEWTELDLSNVRSPSHGFSAEITAGPFSGGIYQIVMNLYYSGEPGSGHKGVAYAAGPIGTNSLTASATIEDSGMSITGTLTCALGI